MLLLLLSSSPEAQHKNPITSESRLITEPLPLSGSKKKKKKKSNFFFRDVCAGCEKSRSSGLAWVTRRHSSEPTRRNLIIRTMSWSIVLSLSNHVFRLSPCWQGRRDLSLSLFLYPLVYFGEGIKKILFLLFPSCKKRLVKSEIGWIQQRDVIADYIESSGLLFYFNGVLFIHFFTRGVKKRCIYVVFFLSLSLFL